MPGKHFVDTEESFKQVWSFRGRIHGTMNLDSLSFTLSQISYLVANLSKKNYKTSVQEISHVSIDVLVYILVHFKILLRIGWYSSWMLFLVRLLCCIIDLCFFTFIYIICCCWRFCLRNFSLNLYYVLEMLVLDEK